MRVKTTFADDTHVKLAINADETFMTNVKNMTLRHLGAKHVKLPGFRAGKAPLPLVEKQVDQTLLQTEFLEEAINRMYVLAAQEQRLRPITRPEIKLKKFIPFTELEVEVEVEIIGAVTLPDYTKMKKAKPVAKVTEKDIHDVVDGLKKRMAERQEVERAAKQGDEVVIDFKGCDQKGQPVSGADGTDYPIVIGSNAFIPGFEANLAGLKPGDEKEFTITFPKDYGVLSLQNKKVVFTVKVKKVQQITEPEADDSFASKAGPFKNLKELRADIKKQLTVERQQQADRDFENELIQEIAGKAKVAVPAKLIDEQVMRAEEAERQNLMYRGQTWQEHLAEEGVAEEEHRTRNRPTAEESVKTGLVLSEIAEKEGITVTPEELEIRLQILKGQYTDKSMQAELDKLENRQEIENSLLAEKTIAKLVDYVKLKEK